MQLLNVSRTCTGYHGKIYCRINELKVQKAKLLAYDWSMRRAFFLNSGQNYFNLIGGDARGGKTLFSCFEIMRYKNTGFSFVEADNI